MLIPESNGVMVLNRADTSMPPAGRTFSTLAGMDGGGLQTPGVMGVGKYYLTQPALAVGRTALHVLGGQAYLSSLPFERFVRDTMGMIAGAGAQDILEVDLGIRGISDWQRLQEKEHDQ